MIKTTDIVEFREEYENLKEKSCAAMGKCIEEVDSDTLSVIQSMLKMSDRAIQMSADMCDSINHIEEMLRLLVKNN